MAYGFYGTTITDILNAWVEFGVFAYVLPFLLIFAVIFGILTKSHILGTNKGVMATVSAAVGLLALYNDYVTHFFESIFPYAGIGLSILLVAFAMGNIGLGLGLMFGGKIEVSNLLRIIIISLTYVVAVCIGKFSAIIDKKDKD